MSAQALRQAVIRGQGEVNVELAEVRTAVAIVLRHGARVAVGGCFPSLSTALLPLGHPTRCPSVGCSLLPKHGA